MEGLEKTFRLAMRVVEEEDKFILEKIQPWARTIEAEISKEDLKKAILLYKKDVVEVVRCKDCAHSVPWSCSEGMDFICRRHGKNEIVTGKAFCYYGMRKEDWFE